MANVIKSICVFAVLLFLLGYTIALIVEFIRPYRKSGRCEIGPFPSIVFACLTILAFMLLGNYLYPFDRLVETELCAELTLSEENELKFPEQENWESICVQSDFSDNFMQNELKQGENWPEMDLKRYSYIYTYGQKIETLTYNVWESYNGSLIPLIKAGHIVYEEEFYSNKIYVYRIPKILIEYPKTEKNL